MKVNNIDKNNKMKKSEKKVMSNIKTKRKRKAMEGNIEI